MSVIDLKTLAGKRFRLVRDESASIDPSHESVPFYVRIPAKYGYISPWSETELAAFCHARRLFRKLLAIDGVKPAQIGDSELRVIFAPEQLDAVCNVLQARKRRQMSPDALARLRRISPFAHTEQVAAPPSDREPPEGGIYRATVERRF